MLSPFLIEWLKVKVQKLRNQLLDALEKNQNLCIFLGNLKIFQTCSLNFFRVSIGYFVCICVENLTDDFTAIRMSLQNQRNTFVEEPDKSLLDIGKIRPNAFQYC